MKENFIKDIQKFLNSPFRYAALLIFLDKKKDFLLQGNIIDKADELEYNAMWDTIIYLEGFFLYAKEPNLVIGVEISVLRVFDDKFKERNFYKQKIKF